MSNFQGIEQPGFYKYIRPAGEPVSVALFNARRGLDTQVAKKEGEKGEIGELMRVTKWDGQLLLIAIFDPTNGQQVGYVAAQRPTTAQPDQNAFETETVISTQYAHRGLASVGREYLKVFLSDNVAGESVVLVSEVSAAEEHRPFVRQMLRRSGATQHFLSSGSGPVEMWVEKVDSVPMTIIPTSLSVHDILFFYDEFQDFSDEDVQIVGEDIFFGTDLVGKLEEDTITVLEAIDPNQEVQHAEHIMQLWQKLRKKGYMVNIAY